MGFAVEDKTLISMFVSQQELWNCKFVQDVSGQRTEICILMD